MSKPTIHRPTPPGVDPEALRRARSEVPRGEMHRGEQ